jgi:hypothetical protein
MVEQCIFISTPQKTITSISGISISISFKLVFLLIEDGIPQGPLWFALTSAFVHDRLYAQAPERIVIICKFEPLT